MAVALAAFAVLGLGQVASAAPVFMPGNHPEADEQNILLGSQQSGTTITGSTNQSGTSVQFTSTQSLTTGGQGQAFLEPTDGGALLTNFVFSVPGGTFRDFIFNPQIGGQPRGGGGDATVTVLSSEGSFDFVYGLGNGNNFLTIVASGLNETFTSVSVFAPVGFNQLQQPRVSGVSTGGGSVPVPGTLTLLGLGLGLTSLGLRRKRT